MWEWERESDVDVGARRRVPHIEIQEYKRKITKEKRRRK